MIMRKLFIILLLATAFSACQKEFSEEFSISRNNPLNDTTWTTTTVSPALTQMLSTLRSELPEPLVDSFDADRDGGIVFGDSLKLEYETNNGGICIAGQSGNASNRIRGKIKIVLSILTNKDAILKAGLTTAGTTMQVLETDMLIGIRLWQNNLPLDLFGGAKISARIKHTAPKNNRILFQAITLASGRDSVRIWKDITSNDNKIYKGDSIYLPGGGYKRFYELKTQFTGWLSSCNWADTSNTSRLNVRLPLNFTNKNTVVYAISTTNNIVLQLRDEAAIQSFFYPAIPKNIPFKLVSLSVIGNNTYMGVTESRLITTPDPVRIEPRVSTWQQVRELLQQLN
jgi:hypothetical protein